ncbi:MAG TPA: hypothetical protein VMI31_05025 [Fimbriimonadaceae bacterium]|nr:hypothetical protein [Fimbriimonadaceae bacterium]
MLGLLVAIAGFLGRPTDEMATVMRLKSLIYRQNSVIDKDDPSDTGQTIFLLRATPEEIREVYPSLDVSAGARSPFPMQAGRHATIARLGSKGLPGPKEEWSIVVEGDDRPWYQQFVARLRSRIGL